MASSLLVSSKKILGAFFYTLGMTFALSFLVAMVRDVCGDYMTRQPNHTMSDALYFNLLLLNEMIPVAIFFAVYALCQWYRWAKRRMRNRKEADRATTARTQPPSQNIYLDTIGSFLCCLAIPLIFELLFQISVQGPRWVVLNELPKQALHFSRWTLLFFAGAAACEEIIWRRMMLEYLIKKVSLPLAITLSCLGFGLIHWLNIPDALPVSNMAMNLIFCVLYLSRSHGIWASTGAHLGTNLAIFFVCGTDLFLIPTAPFAPVVDSVAAWSDYYNYRTALYLVVGLVLAVCYRSRMVANTRRIEVPGSRNVPCQSAV